METLKSLKGFVNVIYPLYFIFWETVSFSAFPCFTKLLMLFCTLSFLALAKNNVLHFKPSLQKNS